MKNVVLAAAILALTAPALGQGAKLSSPIDTDVAALKPGQFIWNGDLAPEGPMTVIVHIPTQRAYVYRNGIRIGVTTVSTGKDGHKTPTGIFTILQKNKDHRSSIYNNAPMPYMLRLTRGGVAIHGSPVEEDWVTHGCIGVPTAFARILFSHARVGDQVIVTRNWLPAAYGR